MSPHKPLARIHAPDLGAPVPHREFSILNYNLFLTHARRGAGEIGGFGGEVGRAFGYPPFMLTIPFPQLRAAANRSSWRPERAYIVHARVSAVAGGSRAGFAECLRGRVWGVARCG